MSYLNLDLSDAKSGMGFDPIPAGEYQAHIINSELTYSKNDDLMLNMAWQIVEGEHAEALVFDRVMLSGSEKAVNFGRRKIKTLAEAVGHPNPNKIDNSEDLHGLPCLITVAIKNYNNEDRNEIKDFKALKAATMAANKPAPLATAAPSRQGAAPPPTPPKKGGTPPPPKSQQQSPFDPPTEAVEQAGGE